MLLEMLTSPGVTSLDTMQLWYPTRDVNSVLDPVMDTAVVPNATTSPWDVLPQLCPGDPTSPGPTIAVVPNATTGHPDVPN